MEGNMARMASVRTTRSYYSGVQSPTTDSLSDIFSVSSTSPRARHSDQLQDLATSCGVPIALSRPVYVLPEERAVPQHDVDMAAAKQLLTDLRPKKFLAGKSSKAFSPDELMLALDHAVKTRQGPATIEGLLQLAEAQGIKADNTGTSFTSSKKGQTVPTIDYIFTQSCLDKSSVIGPFLHHVSQRAKDDALSACLSSSSLDSSRITALVEWGANPERCQDRAMHLISDPDAKESAVEALVLSPRIVDISVLNAALVCAATSKSLSRISTLLLRGADANYNQGETIRSVIHPKCYQAILAMLILPSRAVSPSILDVLAGLAASWKLDAQKPFMVALLLAGAAGPRTSKALVPFLSTLDLDIISMLPSCHAAGHRTFIPAKLFHAALEVEAHDSAFDTLRSCTTASFSDYCSVGAHLQLIDNFLTAPASSLDITTELLKIGTAGDYTSEMLVKTCESRFLQHPSIEKLISVLLEHGASNVSYDSGKALLSSVGDGNEHIVELLLSAKPSKKVLNNAISIVGALPESESKRTILAALIGAGASGSSLDAQFVQAIDGSSNSLNRVLTLLPAASLDHADGQAIVKMISLSRLDILERVLQTKRPQTSMAAIWNQIRQVFGLTGQCAFDLPYVQKSITMLHAISPHSTPVDILLLEATHCEHTTDNLSLINLLLFWGASPDIDLGSPLVASVQKLNTYCGLENTCLIKAIEDFFEILEILCKAGVEEAVLDAALSQCLLSSEQYDARLAQLLVGHGARLRGPTASSLSGPIKNLDLNIVKKLLPPGQSVDAEEAFYSAAGSHVDWASPAARCSPMIKLLISMCSPGIWADNAFKACVRVYQLDGASLYLEHLASREVFDESLTELCNKEIDFSDLQLAAILYLLKKGARGAVVDKIYLKAVNTHNLLWVTSLDEYLSTPITPSAAYESLSSAGEASTKIGVYLRSKGVRGATVDTDFIKACLSSNIKEMENIAGSISSSEVLSQALHTLSDQTDFAHTERDREVVSFLLSSGASQPAVLHAARSAARSEQTASMQPFRIHADDRAMTDAIFAGLSEHAEPFASVNSCIILNKLSAASLGIEHVRNVAYKAGASFDLELLQSVCQARHSAEPYAFAIEAVSSSGHRWMSSEGMRFVDVLLNKGAHGHVLPTMVEQAVSKLNLSALKLVHPRCDDTDAATERALATLANNPQAITSPAGLEVLSHLVKAGIQSSALSTMAERAAASNNYEALDILPSSSVAATTIPAAFRAVARERTHSMSSNELSIASLLIEHGVSTHVLSIAATEAVKLLDLEAMKVLATSPRFRTISNDPLRALMLEKALWCSPDGHRGLEFLLDYDLSADSFQLMVSHAAAAMNFDTLSLVLSKSPLSLTDLALSSLIDAGSAWLSTEGLRVIELLLCASPAPSQASIARAFIQSSEALKVDHVKLLHPHVVEESVFVSAFSAATTNSNAWLTIDGSVVEAAFLQAAAALDLSAMQLLASRIDRADCYSGALTEVQKNPKLRQRPDILRFLLDSGAKGYALRTTYVEAARRLDYANTAILEEYLQDPGADLETFLAATSGVEWLSSEHHQLIELLYNRGIDAETAEPALVIAAAAVNLPMVELLSQGIGPRAAYAALEAVVQRSDWHSENHTSILELLMQHGVRGTAVELALIENASRSKLDLVDLLLPSIDKDRVECFNLAMDAVFGSGGEWPIQESSRDILRKLIESGAATDGAHDPLVYAASNAITEAVQVLTPVVQGGSTYTQAFIGLISAGLTWLEPDLLTLLNILLDNGAAGEAVDVALLNATEHFIRGEASLDLLILLLDKGADVNLDDGRALQLAAIAGNAELCSFSCAASPSYVTLYKCIQEALCSGHDESTALGILRVISNNPALSQNVDVNHQSTLGQPLLFYPLLHYPESRELGATLFGLGASPAATMMWNVYDEETGLTTPSADQVMPLHFALIKYASDDVIRLILDSKPNLEAILARSRATPLILAAKHDRAAIISVLLHRGVKIMQKDCHDRTALFYAARSGRTTAVTSLLKKSPITNDGSLHEAARGLHTDIDAALLATGHDVNFPSFKHSGRSPLCELCYRCDVPNDVTNLHFTLQELQKAKAAPLRECRGRTPLFYAIDNPYSASVVVGKLIEVVLWDTDLLNDHKNVFKQKHLHYSATKYVEKGLCEQPEAIAQRVLDVLQDAGVTDRFYASERTKQPDGARGMPQRIADLDDKKWIRSNRLMEEQEDQERKLRREKEELSQRDELTSRRHLRVMEQKEDLALQTITHNTDLQWQTMQFRSMDHAQAIR
ncbi:hypothetical protein FKW77_004645 [Venturia effusa]|uniref:Uncharacterized protein n=1 Tax=Venturia effusa TaxID=50376 RepID=A0A517L795_9PEZI|nr:hypothetical protein FKW77_004645 [Venturia effusa]